MGTMPGALQMQPMPTPLLMEREYVGLSVVRWAAIYTLKMSVPPDVPMIQSLIPSVVRYDISMMMPVPVTKLQGTMYYCLHIRNWFNENFKLLAVALRDAFGEHKLRERGR